jgi:hypothetical protein
MVTVIEPQSTVNLEFGGWYQVDQGTGVPHSGSGSCAVWSHTNSYAGLSNISPPLSRARKILFYDQARHPLQITCGEDRQRAFGCSVQKQHLTQRFPVLEVFFGLKIFPAFPTIAPNVHSKVDPEAPSQSTGHRWRVTARLLAWHWLEKIRVRQTPALPPQ